MTTTIDVETAQTPLSELISLVMSGSEVILAEGEIPLVRLVPVTTERIPDLHPGAMIISDDFDAPLPDEFWLGKQ